MKACTPWVLLCVLVILILILAALLINNFTGAAAVAAIGGAALSKKRKRAKEIFGGAVKDFWDVKTDKLRTAEETFAGTFFPELQTTNNPNLITGWAAIRDAFKKLSNDLDTAYYADKGSYLMPKGAGRLSGLKMDSLAARTGLLGPTGTRIVGSWAQTYNAFDGVLIYLGDLVDLYRKDGPSIADITTTFPAIKGDLTTYFGRIKDQMRPAVPKQVTVIASVNALETLVGALPSPFNYAATYPLFLSAMDPAAIAAITTDGLANGQSALAMTTVIGLRNAYVAAHNAWNTNRAALTETNMIKNCDNRFKECEDKIVAIINHFTKSPLPPTVTTDCNNDRTKLITAVESLLALGPKESTWGWMFGGSGSLTTLSNAAKNLALCISPLFTSAIAAMDPATITKDGTANGQTAPAMTTVIGLRNTYFAAYNAWKASRADSTKILSELEIRDDLFKKCENKVVSIIKHFTKSKLLTVTVDCNNDRTELITAVEKLLALSSTKGSLKKILTNLKNAANKLALCISPLFPSAITAMDPAAITTAGIANGQSALAMTTVIDLRNAYVAAYNAWYVNRAALTETKVIETWDNLFKECENKVVSIINHFTTGRAVSPTVTTNCNNDRTGLITAAGKLIGLSPPKTIWRMILGGPGLLITLSNAAKNLAFYLPPFPIFVSTMIPPHHEHIAGFASIDPKIVDKYHKKVTLPIEGYHSEAEYTAIRDLNVNYYKFLTWWANARVNPNTYKLAVKDIATVLELQTFMEAIGEAINDELDESYFEKPAVIAPNKWNKTTSDKCAAAILKLKALVKVVDTKITITTLGYFYGKSPQPDWANFKTALTKVPNFDFVRFKRPATTFAVDVFDRPPLTPSQRLIKYKFTPDVEAKFVKEVIPGAHGALVLEASSIEELDAKLARIPESKARIYGLVVDKPGDLVALYKAVAINIGNSMPDELKTKQANVANAATGRLYTTTWMPNIGSSGSRGAYYKEYRDLIKPALYAVT